MFGNNKDFLNNKLQFEENDGNTRSANGRAANSNRGIFTQSQPQQTPVSQYHPQYQQQQQKQKPQENANSPKIFSPKFTQDAEVILDHLKQTRQAVLVKLNDVIQFPDVQRILDFLSGAVYAMDGSIKKVDGVCYLVTPSN